MLRLLCCVSLVALLTGCGEGDYPTTRVTGAVTYNGKPVTTGKIRFVPLGESPDESFPGKPAQGAVQSDGTFVLTTYKDGDGAILGKHRVYYTPPEGGETSETQELDANGEPKPSKASQKKAPFANCGFAQEKIVEVTSGGENVFNLELTTVADRFKG